MQFALSNRLVSSARCQVGVVADRDRAPAAQPVDLVVIGRGQRDEFRDGAAIMSEARISRFAGMIPAVAPWRPLGPRNRLDRSRTKGRARIDPLNSHKTVIYTAKPPQ
jgi:hypothetical protein